MRDVSVLVAHPSADLYGSDRVVIDTVRALRDAGHRVVFTVPEPGPLVACIEALGVDVVMCPTPVLRKSALRPRGALALVTTALRSVSCARRLLHDHAVDVIVVNTVTIPWWLVMARWPGRRRRSLVHVHEAERSAPRWVRRALAAPLLLADRVIANSQFSRATLAEVSHRLARTVEVVPNPVPSPGPPTPPRPALAGPVRLLYVGRLSARKGPDVAVTAVADLLDVGADVTLDLVGAVFPGYEWFEQKLRTTVADRGMADRVRLTGFDSDVWPHLAAADVVLVPSTVDEPFGNTAVEALLAARPAVVSATSGLLEAAAGYDAVSFVEPGDASALAAGIAAVIADWPRWATAAQRDAGRAAERHDPAGYRQRIAEIVAQMAAAPN